LPVGVRTRRVSAGRREATVPRLKPEAGFTVLEAAIALTVLAVSLMTLMGTLVYCSRSNLAAEQRVRALNAAQAKLEELRSRPFDGLIGEYAPGGAIGDRFAVPSIDSEEVVAQGQVVFFVDERANPEPEFLALPLDLNADGDTSDEDVSARCDLLPVRVTIRWDGVLGDQRVDLRTVLRKEE
jgi:type II secretory pathway pseudopilin PulG